RSFEGTPDGGAGTGREARLRRQGTFNDHRLGPHTAVDETQVGSWHRAVQVPAYGTESLDGAHVEPGRDVRVVFGEGPNPVDDGESHTFRFARTSILDFEQIDGSYDRPAV